MNNKENHSDQINLQIGIDNSGYVVLQFNNLSNSLIMAVRLPPEHANGLGENLKQKAIEARRKVVLPNSNGKPNMEPI